MPDQVVEVDVIVSIEIQHAVERQCIRRAQVRNGVATFADNLSAVDGEVEDEIVIAGATGQDIVAGAAQELVVSIAAIQPVPAAVIAWRYTWSCTSPQAKTRGTLVRDPSTVTV